MSTARQLPVGTPWRVSALPPLPMLDGTKVGWHTLLTDRLLGRKRCARGQKTAAVVTVFPTLLSATPGTENPLSGHGPYWLPASDSPLSIWCSTVPLKGQLSYDSSPFPFPPQQPKRQMLCVVLSVRWTERRQVSSHRQSSEPVVLWLERYSRRPYPSACVWRGRCNAGGPRAHIHRSIKPGA